jgi:hypothetical protein
MTPADLNTSPPPYLINEVVGTQADFDQVYANALNIYKSLSSNWVTTNQQNQLLGLPITAVPPIPVRQIAYPSTSGNVGQYDAPVDPAIQPPVLAPYTPIPPTPATQFTTLAPAQDNAVLTQLAQIAAGVTAIRGKLGA